MLFRSDTSEMVATQQVVPMETEQNEVAPKGKKNCKGGKKAKCDTMGRLLAAL